MKENYFYDTRFEYPMNFFSGSKANEKYKKKDLSLSLLKDTYLRKGSLKMKKFLEKSTKPDESINELKLAEHSSCLLGVSKEQSATLQMPYSIMELSYLEYLVE